VPDGNGDQVDAGVVEAGESVLEIDGQAVADAGGEAKEASLAA
jgi:hypothetical protein